MEPTNHSPVTVPVQPVRGLAADIASFAQSKAMFEQGHDAADMAALGGLSSVEFCCVWDYLDGEGYGGSSQIVGRHLYEDDPAGPWLVLDGEFSQFLYESLSPVTVDDLFTVLGSQAWPAQDLSERSSFKGGNVADVDLR